MTEQLFLRWLQQSLSLDGDHSVPFKGLSSTEVLLAKQLRKKMAGLRRENANLRKLAFTDALTNLFNRRFFFTRLEEEFSRMRRYNEHFALLAIDIDNLKTINDNCGHAAGDKIICKIAECLKACSRKGDVIGRLGGDEYGYIMLNSDEKTAGRLSSRMQKTVARITLKAMDEKPTLSIGIAATGSHNFKKYQDIYKAADSALYISKKQKNCISVFRKQATRKTGKK